MPKRLTKEEFVAKAVAVHGLGKYDYSETVYLPMPQKVAIRCPQHGLFMQKAGQHLFGKGCLQCANAFKIKAAQQAIRKWTTETFRKAAAAVMPHLDFSATVYTPSCKFVEVRCPQHGAYRVPPQALLAGRGCRRCRDEKSWIEIAAGRICTLYLLRVYSELESFYKLGITSLTIERRYNSEKYMPYKYEVLATWQSTDAQLVADWEHYLLLAFAAHGYRPQRKMPGATECFSRVDELLAAFPLQQQAA